MYEIIHTSTTKKTGRKGNKVYAEVTYSQKNARYEVWMISERNGFQASRWMRNFSRGEENAAIRYAEVTAANWNMGR